MALPEQDVAYLDAKGYRWELVAASGEQLLILRDYELPPGKYTPAVADAERLYLVGYDRLFGMTPARR